VTSETMRAINTDQSGPLDASLGRSSPAISLSAEDHQRLSALFSVESSVGPSTHLSADSTLWMSTRLSKASDALDMSIPPNITQMEHALIKRGLCVDKSAIDPDVPLTKLASKLARECNGGLINITVNGCTFPARFDAGIVLGAVASIFDMTIFVFKPGIKPKTYGIGHNHVGIAHCVDRFSPVQQAIYAPLIPTTTIPKSFKAPKAKAKRVDVRYLLIHWLMKSQKLLGAAKPREAGVAKEKATPNEIDKTEFQDAASKIEESYKEAS
jgi:hypothetical protein